MTSRTTELTQVKEKPCVDMLLYICVYARLKVYVRYGVSVAAAVTSVVDLAVSVLLVSFTNMMNIYEQICNNYANACCKFDYTTFALS